MSNKTQDNTTQGDFAFPREWSLFGPAGKHDPEPDFAGMTDIPAALMVGGKRLAGQKAAFTDDRLDIGALCGGKEMGKSAWLMAEVTVDQATEAEFGAGADWWMTWWVNGEVVCDTTTAGNGKHPPSPSDHRFTARLKAGRNLIAVEVVSGVGSFVLAAEATDDNGRTVLPEEWSVFGPGHVLQDDAYLAKLPDCGRAKDLLRRMAGGAARGALAYVVPLYDLERCQSVPFGHILGRKWGHDHAMPMLAPSAFHQDPIADAFGAVYHDNPCGTVPRLENVEDIPSLPLEMTLAGGRFGLCLDTLAQLADRARGKVLLQRYGLGGPMSVAGLIVRATSLLEGMYTHPDLVRRLLTVCADLFIAFNKAQRERVPDLVLANLHGDTYWPQGLGILCEDDTIINLSPEMFREFLVPHYCRISEEFNGIVTHCCGNYAHLFPVLRDHVPNVRGVWMNAGECSFRRAVEVFRGTDTVIIPRWVLNSIQHFSSRIDFVNFILATKTPDISVLLQANYFGSCNGKIEGSLAEQNAVSEEILRLCQAHVARHGLPT